MLYYCVSKHVPINGMLQFHKPGSKTARSVNAVLQPNGSGHERTRPPPIQLATVVSSQQ